MDKEFEEKIKKMVKSMYKNVQNVQSRKAKDAIKDILDDNNVAESNPDDLAGHSSNIMNKGNDDRCWEGYKPVKGKKAYSEDSCEKMKKDLKKDGAKTLGIKEEDCYKSEDFVKDFMKSFEVVSSAYIEKMNKKQD